MRTLFAVLLIISLAFVTTPAFAKKKKPAADNEPRIVEVNALSITLSVGKSGDDHEVFKITKDTKITLNNVPSTTDSLRAGMVAKVTPSGTDATTAVSIDAKDAPKQ